MSEEKTGGPAFPQSGVCDATGDAYNSEWLGGTGLSIRDYFAAKALQGMLADSRMVNTTYGEYARKAYTFADQMLETRNV
jgi:hypothetical protein